MRLTVREYLYDNRGNLTRETENGCLLRAYAYNAMNRLGMAWDAEGREAAYEYNGLGQRTARQTADTKETYLLDLTRPYHNLLSMARGADEKAFYWDGNVAAMAERKAADGMTTQREAADGTGEGNYSALHYYLQDELGSPLRVSGYDTGLHSGTGTNASYLTYGYDEFGNDLYERYSDLEATGNPYNRQGQEQPFGYTGYRHDEVSGTYFAQAREYQPQNGRFTAEDVIKNGINWYIYCKYNPIKYIDLNGLAEYVIGEPVVPDQYFDEDFVYNPDKKRTFEDYISYALWGVANMAAYIPMPEAAESYRNYRSATGKDITIDLSKALEEDKSYQQQFNAMIEEAQEYAEQLRGNMNEFSMTGTLYEFKNGSDQNWQKTLGAFWAWGSADITYENGLYTMVYTIHVKDRYNFNKGQKDIKSGVPDSINGKFAELGLAKSFFTYGEATRTITWSEGDYKNKSISDCPMNEGEQDYKKDINRRKR